MRELRYRRKKLRGAIAIVASALLAPWAAAEGPPASSAYTQMPQHKARLALLVEPNGWQEPVVTAAAIDPLEAVPSRPAEPGATFPLEPHAYDLHDVPGDDQDGAIVNGTYVDGDHMNTPYDRVCAPHDPLQPRCRYTDDFMWGCGGSPHRHGPGTCDTWRVGPVWDVSLDGVVMRRESANLDGIVGATAFDSFGDPLLPTFTDQFNYSPGGRLSITGKVPRWVGYRVHIGYEGVEEWNASVIYPKQFIDPTPDPPDVPFATEQRRVHYRSSLHSAEMNIVRCYNTSQWQPYCGVRYIKFDDELTDFIDQQIQVPLPDLNLDAADYPISTTDRLNLFDLQNNLIGFQIGVRRDIWQISRRFSLQGFASGGVYHNETKRVNFMSFTTLEQFEDGSEQVSQTSNNEVTEIADIAYVGEVSLTGVCRLNRCCAVRAGYQVLWIDGLRLAEDAFLTGNDASRDLLFHGWHAGLEYRR